MTTINQWKCWRLGCNLGCKCSGEIVFRAHDVAGFDRVNELIQGGANINAIDLCGDTALIAACRNGHNGVVSFLISRGARVNTKNTRKTTALAEAFRHGHVDIVRMLIIFGADNERKSIDLVNSWIGDRDTLCMVSKKNKHIRKILWSLSLTSTSNKPLTIILQNNDLLNEIINFM